MSLQNTQEWYQIKNDKSGLGLKRIKIRSFFVFFDLVLCIFLLIKPIFCLYKSFHLPIKGFKPSPPFYVLINN